MLGIVFINVYFGGFSEKSAYDNCAILSIVTDSEILFDYDDGIYVMGKTFDE